MDWLLLLLLLQLFVVARPAHVALPHQPTPVPTPTPHPTGTPLPSSLPSAQPSMVPTPLPTLTPTTGAPTQRPTPKHPTHVPTLKPSSVPTPRPSVSEITKSNSWKYIMQTIMYYSVLMVAQLALFEVFRGNPLVYESRRSVYKARCVGSACPPPPVRSRWPLAWVRPTLGVTEEQLLFLVGLDSFVLIRYIKMCWKMCLFATLVCCVVLVPCYVTGDFYESTAFIGDDDAFEKELQTFNRFTLANAVPKTKQSSFLWLPAIFAAYAFCGHTCYLVREEMRRFRDLRTAFFVRGDPQVNPQSLYTVMVENIPEQYRLNVTFRLLFDNLFPGAVHSTEIMQPLASLRGAVLRAERCAEMLEQALIAFRVGRETRVIRPWYARFPCLGLKGQAVGAVEFWQGELGLANKDIAQLQREHFDVWAPREEEARRKLRGDAADIRDDGHLGLAQGQRVRARSEGHLDLSTHTATSSRNTEGSLTSALLQGNDAPLRSSRRLSAGSTHHPSDAGDDAGGEDMYATVIHPLNPFPNNDPLRRILLRGWNNTESVDEVAIGDTDAPLLGFKETTAAVRGSCVQLVEQGRKVLSLVLDRSKRMATSGSPGSTGFVTFNSLAAATAACQTTLCYKSFGLQALRAPEPRDLLWENVMVDSRHASTRKFVAQMILNIGALFFAFLITTFTVIASSCDQLYNADGDAPSYISWINQHETIEAACSYVPAMLGLGVLLIVPWIFLFVAYTYESYKSKVDLEISIFRRYFAYYMAYIIITSITFSFQESVVQFFQGEFKDAATLLQKIAAAVPTASGYFITVLVLKIFFGTTWELSRPWALLSKSIAMYCAQKNHMGIRRRLKVNAADPCRFGWIFPQLVVVMAITMVYQVITPLIAPFGLAYFSLAFLVYKQQVLYVYVNDYESGGKFMPLLLRRTLVIMAGGQVLLFLYFVLQNSVAGAAGAVLTLPLPIFTMYFKSFLAQAYDPLLSNLTHDVATFADQNVQRHRRMTGQSSKATFVTKSFSTYCYMQPWLTQRPVKPKVRRTRTKGGRDRATRISGLSVRSSGDPFRSTSASSWMYAAPVDLDVSVDTVAEGGTLSAETSPAQLRGKQPHVPASPSLSMIYREHAPGTPDLAVVLEGGPEASHAGNGHQSNTPAADLYVSPVMTNGEGLGQSLLANDEEAGSFRLEENGGDDGDNDSGGDDDIDIDEDEGGDGIKELAYSLLHPDQQQAKDRLMSEDEFTEAWSNAMGLEWNAGGFDKGE